MIMKVYNYINKDIKIRSCLSVMRMLATAIVVWMACACVGTAGNEIEVTFEGHIGGITFAVAVSGDYAFICEGQDFVVLDMSDHAIPLELSRLVIDNMIEDITVSGDYAYIADDRNGLVILRVEKPDDWKNEWIGEESEDGSAVTTTELQDAIHHWLGDIRVRGHMMSTADLQEIIVVWLSD